jgi:two-component system, NarL family, response regulator
VSEFRILIVDDFAPFRDVVCSIVAESQTLPELRVVCEASDGLAALMEAERFQPHLTLLDIGLPFLDGIKAARSIRAVAPESKLIFISAHCSKAMVRDAMSTGALGYVVKVDVLRDLPVAVEAAIHDRQFISKRVAGSSFSMPANL